MFPRECSKQMKRNSGERFGQAKPSKKDLKDVPCDKSI